MSKKYIWLVTIVLAISLCGLILIQIKYYQSTAKIKEDQFFLTVSKALDQVVYKMESDDEAKSFLGDTGSKQSDKKINKNKSITGYGYTINLPPNPDQHQTVAASYYKDNKKLFTKETELNPKTFRDLLNKAQDPRLQFSNNRLGGYQNEISFIAASMARQSMSLKERIDMNTIHKSIKEKLANNSIKLDFEYAIKSDNKFEKKSADYFKYNQQDKFEKQLFPNDSFKNSHYIYIFFPGMHKYIIQSYTMLIPSLILSLILILCSAFTIYIIFKQKRLSKIKNDFINNMTHEFKTPISTISLASQMLTDNSVTTTAASINNMAKIINDANWPVEK